VDFRGRRDVLDTTDKSEGRHEDEDRNKRWLRGHEASSVTSNIFLLDKSPAPRFPAPQKHSLDQNNVSLITLPTAFGCGTELYSPPAWKHPMYTEEAMRSIVIAHRETRSWSDWTALGMVRFLRWGTDLLTGYRHDSTRPYAMSERKWMLRFIFLETVAGVPGMVGGMLRHLRSLGGMKRDNGW
jgi:hypothetical protein